MKHSRAPKPRHAYEDLARRLACAYTSWFMGTSPAHEMRVFSRRTPGEFWLDLAEILAKQLVLRRNPWSLNEIPIPTKLKQ